MAKLSTPYHQCEQRFTPTQQGVTPQCGNAAYRKDSNGRWYCRKHLAERRRRRVEGKPIPDDERGAQ